MVGLLRHLLDSSCNYKDICFLLNLGDGLISQDTEEVAGHTATTLTCWGDCISETKGTGVFVKRNLILEIKNK